MTAPFHQTASSPVLSGFPTQAQALQQAPQHPGYYPYPAHPRTANGLGVAGFVLGLVGLVLSWVPVLGLGLAILGVILSGSSMADAKRRAQSNGLGIAGLVLGLVALLPALVILLAVASI